MASATAGYMVFNKSYLNQIDVNVHEIIHLYQFNDFSIFNTYLNKPLTKWSAKNKSVNWLNEHLYTEYHYLILRPLYIFETNNANRYYDNFFEHEAGYFGGTLH
ncbi:hypothetical protein H7F37_13395 [Winogradskyella sp. PAMC22761]|nr:hypothetical protein H7F37_13395 [Winogradskyella sp. PAMC22761]